MSKNIIKKDIIFYNNIDTSSVVIICLLIVIIFVIIFLLNINNDIIYKDGSVWKENKSSHVLTGGVYQEIRNNITDGDTVPIKTSILGGQYTVNEDPASGYPTYVSHFGSLKNGSTYSVFKGNFPDTILDPKQWINISGMSAIVSVGDGMVRLQTGVSINGFATIISRLKGRFDDGQVSVFQSDVRVGVLSENNIKTWGLRSVDNQEGIYFKINGLNFQIASLKAGVETVINRENFSGDKTYTPGDTNNTYIIEYSTGRAIFYRGNAGKKILLHEIVNLEESITNTLNLPIYYSNINSGSIVNSSMYIREASVSIWGSPDKFNEAGAKITGDFGTETVRGFLPKYDIHIHSGSNPNIDTNTDPEDIWSRGGYYTGFDAIANENITIVSTSNEDTGTLVVSGTATGGGELTLIDSSADFINDGVSISHILINDTKGTHGIITSVLATQITVFNMIDTVTARINMNVINDDYRVARSASGVSGAAVIKLSHLLNSNFEEQINRYVILNGTTPITLIGDYMRCGEASVQLAGSSEGNFGNITVNQTITTANVFAYIPSFYNDSNTVVVTVPKNTTAVLKHLMCNIIRANAGDGSANIIFRVRRYGEVFRGYRVFEISTASSLNFNFVGGDIFPEGTDMKIEVNSVSNNGTIASALLEVYIIDNK